ncbi:UNVERIFIED_CONTAM: hypothetical protein Sradi_6193300 [Sesamum radiatum]|uniref:Uncharacterized protein n=1 Tax=Sesamum radiatum TaxID=300843 RepID=A0AAW2K9H2_SESRA
MAPGNNNHGLTDQQAREQLEEEVESRPSLPEEELPPPPPREAPLEEDKSQRRGQAAARPASIGSSYLFTVIQREHESLRDYVQRFSEAVLEVPHVNPELLASIMQQNLRRGRFRESIAGKPPATLDELLGHRGDFRWSGRRDSARARKAALRAARNHSREFQSPEVMMSEELHEKQEIVFGSEDLEKDAVTNNDAVVISVTIANFWVKKVLVDSGSSADIIFYKAFSQMGINNAELTKVNTPLTSFSGSIVEPIGEVMLPISLGSYPKRVTRMVRFLVVDAPSAYNVILGRPSLNSFQAIASTYHLKLKFPTPTE